MAQKLAITDIAVNRIIVSGKAEGRIEGGVFDAESADWSLSKLDTCGVSNIDSAERIDEM